MSYFIATEDVVANAFIHRLAQGGSRFLTYDELECYGNRVVNLLNDMDHQTVWFCSRSRTDYILRLYSDFFHEIGIDNKMGIYLNTGVIAEGLIIKFQGCLPLDVLMVFCDSSLMLNLES